MQGLPSSQGVDLPGLHRPPTQVSAPVQALPSSQDAELATKTQPLSGSQLSSVQTLPSLQTLAGPGKHTPPPQKSPSVHWLASEQGNALAVFWHPFIASQLSVVHGLLSSQLLLAPGVQMPSLHRSATVHTLPSSQFAALFVN